jgi:hypothetical protein
VDWRHVPGAFTVNVAYVHPGKAWLQYAGGWYLVDTRDGPLTDWEIGVALYHVSSESIELHAEADRARLFLRTIWFDDTNGGLLLQFQLLVNASAFGPSESVEELRTEIERDLEEEWMLVPWHGQVVSAAVDLKRCSFFSDHYSDYSSDMWAF